MPRFNTNDAVFILPKFAHLYPSNSAVIISVNPDPFRQMFDQYTVEFADHSTAILFEFQIIEDVPNYNTVVADLIFDSRQQPSTAHTRGHAFSGQVIILQTPEYDLDMKIHLTKSLASIMGQVLERGTNSLLTHVDVQLMKESMSIRTTTSDSLGVFTFSDIPPGSLNILVVIPQHFSRVLGAFRI